MNADDAQLNASLSQQAKEAWLRHRDPEEAALIAEWADVLAWFDPKTYNRLGAWILHARLVHVDTHVAILLVPYEYAFQAEARLSSIKAAFSAIKQSTVTVRMVVCADPS